MSIPTLYDILLQPGNILEESKVYNIETFHKFLLKAHCEENLEFFQYTNAYICSKNKENDEDKNSRSEADLADTSSKSSKLLKLWNNRIYLKYIALNSPRECNFPQEIREVFEKCYREGSLPSDENVLVAMQHILQLLMDAYRQFTKFVNDTENPIEELVTEKSQSIITSFGENDSVSIISKEEEDESKRLDDYNWCNPKESATTYWGMGKLTYPQANYLMTPKVNLSANDIIIGSTTATLAPSVSPLITREISDIMKNNNFSTVSRLSGEVKEPVNVVPLSPKRRSIEGEKRKSGSPILVSPTSKHHSTKYSKTNGSSHVNRSVKTSTSPLSHRGNPHNNDNIKRPISPPTNHNLPPEHHSNTIVVKSKQFLTKLGMVGRRKNYPNNEVTHHNSNPKLT